MYFWRTDKLIEDFKEDNVSQKETMKYFLTLSVLLLSSTFFLELSTGQEVTEKQAMYLTIEYLSVALITILGIYFCYEKNEKVESGKFLERFICFSLPVAIRSFVIIMAIFFLIAIAFEQIKTGGFDLFLDNPKTDVKYSIFYELFFYSGIYKAIGKLQPKEVNEQFS